MNTPQVTSLQTRTVTTPELPGQSDAAQARYQPAGSSRQAVIGGGGCITPAVAAHVRHTSAQPAPSAIGNRSADRKAVIGGGGCITPAVAAHLRKSETK